MTLQSSPAYVQNVVNGNILVSGIYALNAGAFSVNIINPASTGINGTITVIMLSGGYQSAVGNVTIKNVVPVLLGLSAISSSSLVGAQTTLSLSIIRCNPYSAESSFVVSISSATFNLSQANYSSRSVAFPLSVPLTVAGTSMMINNLYNLKYIPKVTPISSGLTVTSLDSNGFAVASIDYTGPSLYASIAVDGLSYSFIRSNTNINGIGQVSITYTARYSSVISQMTINLPTNQSQLLSPTCWQLSSSNLNTSCTVLSSNASSITIVYNNQTQVVLTSVINLQPNANLLEVVMETSTYDLVERSAAAVQPAVLYNPLQVQATINSSVVATNCLLKIKATPTVAVDFGSQIKVVFPASTYTKTTLVPADCSYTVQNVTYTGCQFTISALGWLSQVILPYLGPSAIAVGSTVQIQLPVMNGWTNASFNST